MCKAALGSTKVVSIVCHEGEKKMEKKMNLWMFEDDNKRSIGDNIVVKLKAKEIYSCISQGQKNIKPQR